MSQPTIKQVLFDPIFNNNPIGLQILGICSALAVTSNLKTALVMSIALTLVTGFSNLFMLPMWLLGGSFFSYERFPEAALPFIRALPLTALNDALRKVMNEGLGLGDVVLELVTLGAWGLLSFAVSLKIFRWQ